MSSEGVSILLISRSRRFFVCLRPAVRIRAFEKLKSGTFSVGGAFLTLSTVFLSTSRWVNKQKSWRKHSAFGILFVYLLHCPWVFILNGGMNSRPAELQDIKPLVLLWSMSVPSLVWEAKHALDSWGFDCACCTNEDPCLYPNQGKYMRHPGLSWVETRELPRRISECVGNQRHSANICACIQVGRPVDDDSSSIHTLSKRRAMHSVDPSTI